MPSPFPGMDPWLERPALFPDLHDELISCLRTVLNRSLPAGYAALGSSLVWVDPFAIVRYREHAYCRSVASDSVVGSQRLH